MDFFLPQAMLDTSASIHISVLAARHDDDDDDDDVCGLILGRRLSILIKDSL